MEKPIALFAEIESSEERIYKGRLIGYRVFGSEDPLTESTLARFSEANLRNAQVLSVMIHSKVTSAVLNEMPNLEHIVARSTGFDHIDCQEASLRGIEVSTVPEYGSATVAEYTFGLILNLTRHIHKSHLRTVTGDFSYDGLLGTELSGKTLGIVGLGRIGRHVSRMGQAFDMKVLAFDPLVAKAFAHWAEIPLVSLHDLLASSDIIAICCPLTKSTHHLLDDAAFSQMKDGVLVVNTARGAIVDPTALIRGLQAGRVAGAALDVLEGEASVSEEAALAVLGLGNKDVAEALAKNLALIRHPNVIVTPHMAYFTNEALERIRATTIDNIRAFEAGASKNLVRLPASAIG